VKRYELLYDRLRAASLSMSESLDLLIETAKSAT
jgi:hypothetical protein